MSLLLRRARIVPGETILVESGGATYEGMLMPHAEHSAPDVLVLKLSNGYNIGIAAVAGMRVSKPHARTERARIDAGEKARAPEGKAQHARLPRVRLIYTGGTIGSKVDYLSGGVYTLTKPEELLAEVPELSGIARIGIDAPFNIFSEDMSHREWQRIATLAANAVSRGSRGVVVTMGTDTMHYAAAALSFMLNGINAPIVITGAQRSSDRGSSDAFMNLACATAIAARSEIAEVGICMHAGSADERCALIRGVRARKLHTSRRDAFRSVNEAPLAYVNRTYEIKYCGAYRARSQRAARSGASFKPLLGYERNVALIKAYPGSDPGIIDYYLSRKYKGMIIEATGMGNLPISTPDRRASWLGALRRARDSGVVVGITSQCVYGRVNPNVYRTMRIISGLGAVYCEDMLAETALVKLGWLLGNHAPERARALLAANIAGEIKERSMYHEFLA